jgi:hypothetical protein
MQTSEGLLCLRMKNFGSVCGQIAKASCEMNEILSFGKAAPSNVEKMEVVLLTFSRRAFPPARSLTSIQSHILEASEACCRAIS